MGLTLTLRRPTSPAGYGLFSWLCAFIVIVSLSVVVDAQPTEQAPSHGPHFPRDPVRRTGPGRRCAPAGVRTAPCHRRRRWAGSGTHSGHTTKGHRIRGKAACRCWPFWVPASVQSTGGVTKRRVASITPRKQGGGPRHTRQASPVRWRRSAEGRLRPHHTVDPTQQETCDPAARYPGARGSADERRDDRGLILDATTARTHGDGAGRSCCW